MKKTLLVISILFLLTTSACSASSPQTQSQTDLPLTEADVPRLTVEEAKLALDSGKAVIVDVRSAEAYAEGHVSGAISIPLGLVESNPSGLDLEKDQWIITYCT